MSESTAIKIFEPTDNSMLEEYPELKRHDAFSKCTDEQLRFTWYYGNVTSEYYRTTPIAKKIEKCFDKAFKNFTPSDRQSYINQDFPYAVIEAVAEWRQFNPEVRNQASKMLDMMFDSFKKSLDKYYERDDDETVTAEELKEQLDVMNKMSSTLPNFVAEKEKGFGVRKQKGEEEFGESRFDRLMKKKPT